MNLLQRLPSRLLVFTLALLVAGCASSGAKESVQEVEGLASRIERVHETAERAKERARGAVDRLSSLVAPDFDGDAVAAYMDLVDAVELSERDAERLRGELEPMRKAAEQVFAQWEADLEAYSSPRIRQRSSERLAVTRQRFDAIVKSLTPALDSLDTFHAALRDQVLFLEHDLNREAAALVQPEAMRLAQDAGRIEATLDVCLATTQAYVAATLAGG